VGYLVVNDFWYYVMCIARAEVALAWIFLSISLNLLVTPSS